MDRATRLGEGGIGSLLLKFSTPAIVGMIAQALYNVVDRIFVGQGIGPQGIAGVTVAFPFMMVMMAFGMLVGFGAASLISIRLGQKRRAEAEQALGNGLVLLAGIGVAITVVGLLFLDPGLRLFGASPAVLPYARQYLQVILLGAVFQTVGFGLNAVIRGEGNPRIAMATMLIGAVLNTILDPILIFGFGWAMRGAALATVLSQAVSATWVLSYFLRGRSLLRLRACHLRLRAAVCLPIVAMGSPQFTMHIAASVINGILNNQLYAYGGDLAISAMGVVYAVMMLVIMPIFGINQGAQPIIGYNYGAGNYDRVKKTLQAAAAVATLICMSGFLAVMLYPTKVIALFSRDEPALVELGARAICICLAMLPIVGFQIVGASYFQAVGKPKHAMFLGLSRQVLLLIPAVLILPRLFGLDGLWAALPAADLGSSVLTGIWLFAELRHLHRRHGETIAARNLLGIEAGHPLQDSAVQG
ncbi:MAG: MATE family efflux transporter [Pirellulales bacterium]|nr:MATE family efflux transporter [Pirellulales bacterium]